jgi:hypothetical protein
MLVVGRIGSAKDLTEKTFFRSMFTFRFIMLGIDKV